MKWLVHVAIQPGEFQTKGGVEVDKLWEMREKG